MRLPTRLLLLILLALAGVPLASAQATFPPIRVRATDPASCSTTGQVGELKIYYSTADKGFRFCSATNTWSKFPPLASPTFTGTVTADAFATTASNGGISATEGTGASLTAGAAVDLLFPDSTTHAWTFNTNNAGAASLGTCAANTFCFGGADQATSTAYTIKGQDVAAGTAGNVAGANITYQAPNGVGSGGGGSFIFQTGKAHGSDTVKDTQTTAMTINASQQVLFADGAAATPAWAFASAPGTGAIKGVSAITFISASSAKDFTIQGNVAPRGGTVRSDGGYSWSSTTASDGSIDTVVCRQAAGVVEIGTTVCNTSGNLQLAKITSYNATATAGNGVPSIVGMTSQKSETGADTNVLTVTPAAAAGTYRVTISWSVQTATSAVIGWTLTYTDAAGGARTPTNMALFQVGTAAPALTFTAGSASDYYATAIIDVDASGTNIVVKTTMGTGTLTASKLSATIERLN